MIYGKELRTLLLVSYILQSYAGAPRPVEEIGHWIYSL